MQDYQRVVWAEGVFLGQQHFQLWDQYHARELATRDGALRSFAWGLIDLDLAPAGLADGEFRLTRCRLLLPDGRLIAYQVPNGEQRVLTLPESGDRVEVFAGLPRNDSARGIAGYPAPSGNGAWQVDYREVADQHDPTRVREVALARPNLMLLRGDEPRDQLDVLKLMELVRAPDGGWRADETFIPAVCQIGASDALLGTVRRIDERLAARIRVLDERRRRLGSVADFGPSDLSQFLLLQELRPVQTALGHVLGTHQAHPESVYLELARLIAALTAFHPEAAPAGVPAYDHNRLGEVFGACESAVMALLSDALPSRMTGLQLVGESDALRVARDVNPEQLHRGTFFLAVWFDADDPAWVTDFARQVKIAAREDIELILASALQGVPLVHVQRPPNRLPIKSGYEYFRLEAGGEFWQRIVEHHTLAVFIPREFTSASIDVLTIEEQ